MANQDPKTYHTTGEILEYNSQTGKVVTYFPGLCALVDIQKVDLDQAGVTVGPSVKFEAVTRSIDPNLSSFYGFIPVR